MIYIFTPILVFLQTWIEWWWGGIVVLATLYGLIKFYKTQTASKDSTVNLEWRFVVAVLCILLIFGQLYM